MKELIFDIILLILAAIQSTVIILFFIIHLKNTKLRESYEKKLVRDAKKMNKDLKEDSNREKVLDLYETLKLINEFALIVCKNMQRLSEESKPEDTVMVFDDDNEPKCKTELSLLEEKYIKEGRKAQNI